MSDALLNLLRMCYTSESDGTGKSTLEKGGRDPPDVTLDKIADDLLSDFKEWESFNKAEENIKMKYAIKMEHEHNCWPEDDIKRAWGKIQRMDKNSDKRMDKNSDKRMDKNSDKRMDKNSDKRMDKNSDKRKDWSVVVLLQMVKRRYVCDECKLQAAQENRHATTDEQGCETTPSLKGKRSSQRNAELERVGAAGGVEQLFAQKRKTSSPNYSVQPCAAGGVEQLSGQVLKTSKCKPTEDSGLASESPLSTSNTDVADVHDKENVRRKDNLLATVDMNRARMKGNETSSQRNSELETEGAAGGVKQCTGPNRTINSTHCCPQFGVSQGQTGTHFPDCSGHCEFSAGAPGGQYWPGVALQNEYIDENIYIRIPFHFMFCNEPLLEPLVQPVPQPGIYKLINGTPSDFYEDDLRKKKSYAMSFNNETNNAEWVYEIMNSTTLAVNDVKDTRGFGDPYQKGHLAAAANHRWCQEAYSNANLLCNIVPQHRALNNGLWKRAENRCRYLSKQGGVNNVHVYSGPLYLTPMDIQIQEKEVPSHFFKVIIVERDDGTVEEPECYELPNWHHNVSTNLAYHQKPIGYIENVSRLTFIESRHNVRGIDQTVKVALNGKDQHNMPKTAEIQVKIRL